MEFLVRKFLLVLGSHGNKGNIARMIDRNARNLNHLLRVV